MRTVLAGPPVHGPAAGGPGGEAAVPAGGVLLLLDADGVAFSRTWCGFEIARVRARDWN